MLNSRSKLMIVQRKRLFRCHKFVFSCCAILFASCASSEKIEVVENLGHGFHHYVFAEPTVHPSESIGHFDYLYYKNRKLSQTAKFAVAPSGQAVVYQDGQSGNIFLFQRKGESTIQLTSASPGPVETFAWKESEGYVAALFVDGQGSRKQTRFALARAP